MHIHTYKLNFNSTSGLCHVRKTCLRFTRNIF
ncbi:putative translational regulatory protein ArgL [Kosakonia oryziphila]